MISASRISQTMESCNVHLHSSPNVSLLGPGLQDVEDADL